MILSIELFSVLLLTGLLTLEALPAMNESWSLGTKEAQQGYMAGYILVRMRVMGGLWFRDNSGSE